MAKKSGPQILLDLPAFALGVFILYWSMPLSALLGYLRFWKLTGKRDDAYGWAKGLQKLFGVTVLQLQGPTLCKASKIIYLANHRSWADFFLDVVMTNGRAQMLSRMMVLAVFPAFMFPVKVMNSVILFQRGKKVDIQAFNQRISRDMDKSPVGGLIVYPEGHRNTRVGSLSLKRGMLHYCYDYKVTVQIIITKNKEAVLSEKDMSCHFGQTVLCGYAEPLDPSKFDSFQAFMDQVQRVWDSEWERVYSAHYSDGFTMKTTSFETHNYPEGMKQRQLVVCSLSCLAFLLTQILGWRVFLRFTSIFGSLQVFVLTLLATWVGVSLARSFQQQDLPDSRDIQRAV